MLPVEAQTIARAPASAALATARTMPAVLERAGRVLALDLEVQVAQAERRAEPLGADQRREALAEGQRRRRVGDRQEAPVALHQPRPGGPERRPRLSHRSGTGCRWLSQESPVSGVTTASPRRRRAGGRRGPQVEPAAGATAIRSPRTADEVAGTAGAGTVEADASDRRRVDLDAVADAGGPPERRVARERGRAARPPATVAVVVDRRVATSRMIRPACRASAWSARLTVVIPGRPARRRRRGGSRSPPGPASGRTPSRARMTSLLTASWPSTSPDGSASA